MSDSVIVALITGICAIIGAYVGQSVAGAKTSTNLIAELRNRSDISDTEIKGDIAVIKTEIADLRKEVSKHNSVIERTYKLEQKSAVIDEQIKVANHRIDDLEKTASR